MRCTAAEIIRLATPANRDKRDEFLSFAVGWLAGSAPPEEAITLIRAFENEPKTKPAERPEWP